MKGFKLTNQRAIILDYLKENHEHPSVEDVYKFVRQKLPRISKKTVYSNLQFLSDERLIQEVQVKGVQRYEPKLDPHHHLICRRCQRINDLKSGELFSHAMETAKDVDDFEVESVSVNFYGICKDCKEGERWKMKTK